MCSPDTAIVYPGMRIFKGTNISKVRGTDKTFEYIVALWINSNDLVEKLNSMSLPSVSF